MTNKNNTFSSDNLSFVASCLILGVASIEKVEPHPTKNNFKIFHLSPKEEVESTYKDFINDKLKVSPQQLNSKISAIRNLPVSNFSNGEKNQHIPSEEMP